MKKLNQHISIYGGLLLCAMIFARYLSAGTMMTQGDQVKQDVVSYHEDDEMSPNYAANYTVYQSPLEIINE